jgi:hypothetical protein
MAEPRVAFEISVEGAPRAVDDVTRVRTALAGVGTSLDAGAGATQRYAQSSAQMGEGQKQVAVLFSASGKAITSSQIAAGTSTSTLAREIEASVKSAVAGTSAHSALGAALRSGGQESTRFARATGEARKELFEGASLGRHFAATLLGDVVPGLGAAAGMFTSLKRETGGFSLAMVGATVGIVAAAAVVGHFISLERDSKPPRWRQQGDRDPRYGGGHRRPRQGHRWVDPIPARARAGADRHRVGVHHWPDRRLHDEQHRASRMRSGVRRRRGPDVGVLGAARRPSRPVASSWTPRPKRLPTSPPVRSRSRPWPRRSPARPMRSASRGSRPSAAPSWTTSGPPRGALRIASLRNASETALADKREEQLAEDMAIRDRQRAAERASLDQADIAAARPVPRIAGVVAQQIADAGRLDAIRRASAITVQQLGAQEIETRQRAAQADAAFYGTALTNLAGYQAARAGRDHRAGPARAATARRAA